MPWILLNFNKHASKPINVEINHDLIESTMYNLFSNLKSCSQENDEYIYRTLGYSLKVCKSSVHSQGVFVGRGTIKAGTLIGIYPGTIYLPGESILLPSIRNQFIFQCCDGVRIDGKNKGFF